MMNLIKCEMIKNTSWPKRILIIFVCVLSVILGVKFKELIFRNKDNPEYVENIHYQTCVKLGQEMTNDDKTSIRHLLQVEYLKEKEASYKKLIPISYEEKLNPDSWKLKITDTVIYNNVMIYWLNSNHKNKNDIAGVDLFDGKLYHYISSVKELPIKEREEKIKELEKENEELTSLFEKDKYYLYIDYALKNNKIDDYSIDKEKANKYLQMIVDKKIEKDTDYRAINILQMVYHISIDKYVFEEEARHIGIEREKFKKDLEVLDYSIKYDKKHDLALKYNNTYMIHSSSSMYPTSKYFANSIFYYGIIVMFLLVLTCGNFIAKEHNRKTEKLLLATPNKRWKILLSKFIYLILHMYAIWYFIFFILFIYVGIKYGFTDLFSGKMIYQHGKVVEVNYLLYMIKQIFYVGLPVIAFASILFLLSTLTLNTALTSGLSMLLAIFSNIWFLILDKNVFPLISITPIPYLQFSQVLYLEEGYVTLLDKTNITDVKAILICFATSIICILLSNIIYIKRDIKN